jgi:succinate dehydrogenase / fumarate reductase cytochrome b subunit
MALFLNLLAMALESDAGFDEAASLIATPAVKLFVWLVLTALIYHLVAGIRHLLMDFHIGDTLQGGRLGSQLTLVTSSVLTVLAGVWLW